jgi:nitroreductase
MDTLQAIRTRRSVRDFNREPVSTDMLYQVIAAAGFAPSAMNEQPWHFTIVNDTEILNGLSKRAKAWMVKNVSNMPRSNHFRDILNDPDFDIFYGAPVLVLISAPTEDHWAAEDCSVAAQNLMLMATSLGLGSCWIGFSQDWLNTPDGREFLSLSQQSLVVAPIVLGHPKAPPPPVARKAPAISWVGQKPAHPPVEKTRPQTSRPHPLVLDPLRRP